MTDTEHQHDERNLWRDARVAAMESILGTSDTVLGYGVNLSESNADLEIIFFRNHLNGVIAATSGLIGCDNQIRNDQGNYELVICCRGNDEWGPNAICDLANYTLRAALNPGETMDIKSMTPDGSSIVAFLFCDFGRFKVRGRDAGLLLCLGITAGELSQCRNGNQRQVESTLKDAGIYPFTDLSRETTASSVLIPRRVILAFNQLAGFAVLPPFMVFGTLVAWFRLIRLVGLRNAMKKSMRISRIRYRQPLRGMRANAPGCPLIIFGTFIAVISWTLQSHPDQLRIPMAVFALILSASFYQTASNRAFPVVLLAFSYIACFVTSETVFVWAVTIFLGLLGCVAVGTTLQGMLPPIVLFLGVSSYEQFKTLKRAQKTVPCLVVTLINQVEESVLRQYDRHYRGMGLDSTGPRHESLRTRDGLWEQTVRELIDMVPIVILDTRVVSDHVLQEAAWMLQPERLHQVTFVTDDEGNAPVLESILPKNEIYLEHRSRLVKEDELCDRISQFTNSHDALPSMRCHNVPSSE